MLLDYESNTFLHGDGSFYATMNRSLLDGTLQQRDYQPVSWYEDKLGWNHHMDPGWSNVSLGGDGKTWYPKHPTLMPIVATVFFVPLGYAGLLLFNLLALVIGLTGAYRLSSRYVDRSVAMAVTLALASLPMFTRNAYAYSNDVFYGALVVWGYEWFFAGRIRLAGLLLGMSIWAKATNAVIGLPLGVGLLAQRRWRDAAWLAAMTALPVSIHLAMNAWMFGSPLTSSYNRVLVMIGGKQALSDVKDSFGRPFVEGIEALWKHKHEGLRSNAWMLVPSVAGIALVWRRNRLLCLSLVWGLAAYFALFIPYEYTYARFFLPWALLLFVPMSLMVAELLRLSAPLKAVNPKLWLAVGLALWAGLSIATRLKSTHWTASEHITEAQVFRGDGNHKSRCDYFNLRHMKWECAMVDREVWQRWGLPVANQCEFDAMSNTKLPMEHGNDWMWVHPNPRISKKMIIKPPPGDLLIRYGLANKSQYKFATLQVRPGKDAAETWRVEGVGKIHQQLIAASKRGQSLELTVPRQAHDWRHLCVAVRVSPPQ